MVRIGYDRREGALCIALALAFFAISVAWIFELAFGYIPCKLCLWQRWPYYVGIPLIVLALVSINREGGLGMARGLSGLVTLAFLASFTLGVYHAGIEWKFWAGPADCGGRIFSGPASVQDFTKSLASARMVSCTDAPWRLLGLSFAGWNALISAVITGFALRATRDRD
ncbi:MAG: disulfide bond formation protein B [Rhabdaerophilum sp.]